MEDKLKLLYNNLKDDYNLPDFEQFKFDLQDDKNLIQMRETLIADNFEVPELNMWKEELGLKKKDFSQEVSDPSSQEESIASRFTFKASDFITPNIIDIGSETRPPELTPSQKLEQEIEQISYSTDESKRLREIDIELNNKQIASGSPRGEMTFLQAIRPDKEKKQLEEERSELLPKVREQEAKIRAELKSNIKKPKMFTTQ